MSGVNQEHDTTPHQSAAVSLATSQSQLAQIPRGPSKPINIILIRRHQSIVF